MTALSYLHLPSGQQPPTLGDHRPFKAVVVIEQEVTSDWQTTISEWLVRSGCLYMMAWGRDCSSWDDSVDYASLDRFEDGEVPDEVHVMTTWHDDESLDDTFSFAEYCTSHPAADLDHTVIVHITAEPQEARLLEMFEAAKTGTNSPIP